MWLGWVLIVLMTMFCTGLLLVSSRRTIAVLRRRQRRLWAEPERRSDTLWTPRAEPEQTLPLGPMVVSRVWSDTLWTPRAENKINFVITTCLVEREATLREAQYRSGISHLLGQIQSWSETGVVIVENNGPRVTFLDEFAPVCYTSHNESKLEKGVKELMDVQYCIRHYQMSPESLVVKMTGRYICVPECPFLKLVATQAEADAVVKYGAYFRTTDEPCGDCVTGLIALKAKHWLALDPTQVQILEWLVAAKCLSLPRVVTVKGPLGLYMCAGGNEYNLI